MDIDGYACLEMSSGKILVFNLLDVKFDESVLPFKAGALNHTDDLDVELDARGLDALGRPPDLAPFDEADPELLPAATPRPSWPPLSGAPSGLVPELRSAEPHPHEEESWTVSFLDPSPPATSTTVAATRQAASRHPPAAPTAVRPRQAVPVQPAAAPIAPHGAPLTPAAPAALDRPATARTPSLVLPHQGPLRTAAPDLAVPRASPPPEQARPAPAPPTAPTSAARDGPPAAAPRRSARNHPSTRSHDAAKVASLSCDEHIERECDYAPTDSPPRASVFLSLASLQREPLSHAQAMRRPDAAHWRAAEELELKAMSDRGVFGPRILVKDLSPEQRKKVISTQWVYRLISRSPRLPW